MPMRTFAKFSAVSTCVMATSRPFGAISTMYVLSPCGPRGYSRRRAPSSNTRSVSGLPICARTWSSVETPGVSPLSSKASGFTESKKTLKAWRRVSSIESSRTASQP